ncbi:MAG: general secretion pathway protein GspK, partial [Desulfovibrionales bacterium]|nr:general secretion pathway protein GspK [Desulfovibrionales bacterium]
TWQQGRLSIKISPCASKLNLNLADLKEQQAERMENALLNILTGVNLTADDISSLQYWSGVQDSDKRPPYFETIPQLYSSENKEYKAPRRALTRPEELLLIPGFEDLDPGWIRRHFTVWGEQAGIDINSADRGITLALLPELEPYWDRLDSYRQKRNITHPNELIKNAGLDIATYRTVLPYIIINPEVFEIIIEVREGSWYEKHRYIVQRNIIDSAQTPQVLVRDVLERKPL